MHYKNSFKQIILPVIIAGVLVIGFFMGKLFSPASPGASDGKLFIYPQKSKVESILNLI